MASVIFRLRTCPLAGPARNLATGHKGGMLVETILVVMIFAVVGTTVLAGMSGTRSSGARTKVQSAAENIARNQMEYAFSLPYREPPDVYPAITLGPEYAGYGVSCAAQVYQVSNPNIEKVVVTVTSNGEDILVLETLRSKT